MLESIRLKVALRFGAALVVCFAFAGMASAAPEPTGACCNDPDGCCPPLGNCFETTAAGCFFGFQGTGTLCSVLCPTTTTTILSFGGCCFGNGSCADDSEATCMGAGGTYQGDGNLCVSVECQATTTTMLPLGGCCFGNGSCADDSEATCMGAGGNYQGDGNLCASVECQATTTTTLGEEVLCGDANSDDDVSAADALIALRTSVGTAMCPLVRCDYNGSGEITAPDALAILRAGVGLSSNPMCPLDT